MEKSNGNWAGLKLLSVIPLVLDGVVPAPFSVEAVFLEVGGG
jgi:hypothetical protein